MSKEKRESRRERGKKIREKVFSELMEYLLSKEKKIWEIPWETGFFYPRNAVTEKPYKGINFIRLYLAVRRRGFSDPRWVGFKQAKEKGWNIKKGAKGEPIVFFDVIEKEKVLKGNSIEEVERKREELLEKWAKQYGIRNIEIGEIKYESSEDEKKEEKKEDKEDDYSYYCVVRVSHPIWVYHYVFNAEEVEGIPEFKPPIKRECDFKRIEIYEKLLKMCEKDDTLPKVDVRFRDEAYYRIDEDKIYLPAREQFKDEREFYCALLHEICHSTMKEGRVGRKWDIKEGLRDKKLRAFEEFIAEVGAFLTSVKVGIPFIPNSSYTYVKNHLEKYIPELKMRDLYSLFNTADKVSEWVIEKYKLPRLGEKTKEDKENLEEDLEKETEEKTKEEKFKEKTEKNIKVRRKNRRKRRRR